MNAKELRNKSSQELRDELAELLKEQFKLRMQKGTGQMANPARFNTLRKDIARVKTVLNESGN